MKNRVRGFTLLELLVVIVLMVMAISITSVNIVSGQDGAQMKTSARQLLSVLRSARTLAITGGVEAGITLGAGGLSDKGPGARALDPDDRGFENPHRAYTIVPANQIIVLPGELSLSLIDGARQGLVPPGSVLFYPDGSSSGGRLELGAPGGKMTIDINWLTGEVTLANAFDSAATVVQTTVVQTTVVQTTVVQTTVAQTTAMP